MSPHYQPYIHAYHLILNLQVHKSHFIFNLCIHKMSPFLSSLYINVTSLLIPCTQIPPWLAVCWPPPCFTVHGIAGEQPGPQAAGAERATRLLQGFRSVPVPLNGVSYKYCMLGHLKYCNRDHVSLCLFIFILHLDFVHPVQDVALHQCLPLSSVCCFPNPGGSLLLCYVILPSSAWLSSRPLTSPWLPLCASLCPPIVL